MNRRRALKTIFCSSAALALQLRDPIAHAAIESDAIHILAIGDFGTTGEYQIKVADALKTFVANSGIKPDSMFLLGDNFYGKVKDGFHVKHDRWKQGIEDMYPATSFPGKCWAILGNHDYHDNQGGEQIQLEYAKQSGARFQMPDKWYRFDIGGPSPVLTVIALDTNYPNVSGGKIKAGKPTSACLTTDEVKRQIEWLEAELEMPRAPLTLVMGHHPLYSNGSHGDTQVLIDTIGPLLTKHRVHAYICGHDHDLQHLELEDQFTSFVLSGGGGARTRELKNKRETPYGRDVYGFTHIQVEPTKLTFTHHGIDQGALHRFSKSADGSFVISHQSF